MEDASTLIAVGRSRYDGPAGPIARAPKLFLDVTVVGERQDAIEVIAAKSGASAIR